MDQCLGILELHQLADIKPRVAQRKKGGGISTICGAGERQPYQTKALSNDQISNVAITRKDPILRTSFTETHELSDYRESILDCQLVPNDRESAGCRPSAAHDPRERGAGE